MNCFKKLEVDVLPPKSIILIAPWHDDRRVSSFEVLPVQLTSAKTNHGGRVEFGLADKIKLFTQHLIQQDLSFKRGTHRTLGSDD